MPCRMESTYTSILVLIAVTAAALYLRAEAIQGLSAEQEAWVESVSYGNISMDWPPLSVNQSGYLLINVQTFEELTRTANYPYHQAVEVWYSGKNRSQVVYYDDCGDGAAWTGLHLSALVHQFIVTKDPSVMEDLWNTLEAIDMLTMCTGKPGYIEVINMEGGEGLGLARFAGLATDPAYAKYYTGYTNGAYECVAPYENYVWLGYSSRDMYDGVSFGLANAWVWLHSNMTIRSKVQTLVERIVDTLKEDDFWIISPKKKIVNPLPLFSATWRKLALSVNYNKYKDMETAYAADFILAYELEMHLGPKNGAEAYYANELMVEGLYVLSVLEEEDTRKNALLEKFTKVAVDDSDYLQPGYAAFFLSAFPNTTEYKIPQGVLQGGLYDYPSAPDWDHYVDQSNNPKYLPHYDSDHSDYALMIRDRPPTTYFWQREPTILKGGSTSCCLQRKHLDLILPYWMGRSSGYIPVPWGVTA